MNSTTIRTERHAVQVHGTLLGAALRTLLRSFGYCPAAIADVVDFVGVNGTASGSPADAVDVAAVNELVVNHTGHLEYESAADWPAAWDGLAWGVSDRLPPPPFEPDPADRLDWAIMCEAESRIDHALDRMGHEAAALDQLTRGLTPFGGVIPRVVPGWTDADQARHHGYV